MRLVKIKFLINVEQKFNLRKHMPVMNAGKWRELFL